MKEIIQSGQTDKIMFFDDGSYSGTQLTSIMQEYLGIEDKMTKEEHVQALPQELRDVFCKKELVFFLIAFNKSKEEKLKSELLELGLSNVSFDYINDMSNKYLEKHSNSIFIDDDQRECVKDLLKNVGFELMESTKKADGEYKDGSFP